MINFCKLLDARTGHLERQFDPVDISEYRDRAGTVIWLDLLDPDDDDMALIKEEFGFHTLAIEDCRNLHQRPKLERYQSYVFFVVYEIQLDAETRRMTPVELDIFLGSNYVVTVHHTACAVVSAVEARWEVPEANENHEGSSYLAYLLIDGAVDSYFPMLDAFSDRLEELEDGIFVNFDTGVVQDIFQLKKETLLMRRLVTPLRDVFLILLRREEAMFGQRTYLYFQDVLDHLLRISDSIDTYRDLVGSAVDAYMSAVSNRTNETMKKLTVLSTVLMTCALIAGIYGMNFRHMPELGWRDGYFLALGLMAFSALVLTGLFRWKKYI